MEKKAKNTTTKTAKKTKAKAKRPELKPEDTADGHVANAQRELSGNDQVRKLEYSDLSPEQLNCGVSYTLHRLVRALHALTEAERQSLLRQECDTNSWKFACEQWASFALLISTFIKELNDNPDELGGHKFGLGTKLFSPITGETTDKLFIGDIDIDIIQELHKMPPDAEQADKMLHDVQQRAVDWLIDHMTGTEQTVDSEAFVKKFAKDFELNIADLEIHRDEEGDDI